MFLMRLTNTGYNLTRMALGIGVTGLFLFLLIDMTPVHADSHTKGNIKPCMINLVFGFDENGMSVVSYELEMQLSNRQTRTIQGISLHWLNSKSEVIGNSDAVCGQEHNGIKPAQSGSCRRVVQKIGSQLLDRLGQDTWTQIINSELANFREVRQCAIIGYRFGDAAIKSY